MGSGQHGVVVFDQPEHRFQFRDHLPVPDQLDSFIRIFPHFFQVPAGGLGGQPDDLGSQLQAFFHRFRIHPADDLIHDHTTVHGEVGLIPINLFHIGIGDIRPVHRKAQVGFDHKGPGPYPDRRIRQFQIVVGPQPQIRIGVYMHIANAFQ